MAIFGVSRQANDYSRLVFQEFRQRGYDIVPVNPSATEIDGIPCYASLEAVAPPVEAALLLVSAKSLVQATRDCLKNGVRHLFFRQGENSSPEHRMAVALAREAGASVIAGECPLMFLPDTGWIHRAHAAINKITGHYPR
jgi:predicted CoA-binding protein